MDMKYKVVLVMFIALLVGYAVYFVVKDFSNQKKNDKIEKRITESFENYDARTNILNQLDTFKIDKKLKNAVFQTMSKNIEKYQDIPEEKLNQYITDIIKQTKKEIQSKPTITPAAKEPEAFTDDEEAVEAAEAETDADEPEAFKEEPVEDFTQALTGNVTKQDIAEAIDNTSMHLSNLEKDLVKIKSLVNTFANDRLAEGKEAKSDAKPERKPMTAPAKKPTATGPSIEGFENFGGRGYSFI